MGIWQYAVSPRRQASQVPSSPPRTRLLHAGQPPRCGQLLHAQAHVDTRRRAVVPQRYPRLSDIHRKPLPGYVLVPHRARRQACRRGEKSRVWLSRPPYTFFPFSSPIDLEELMCRPAHVVGHRPPHYFGSFNPCLDSKCRSLAFLLGFSGWETRVTTFTSLQARGG